MVMKMRRISVPLNWSIYHIYHVLVSLVFLHFWALAQAKHYLQMIHTNNKLTSISLKVPLNVIILTSLPWWLGFLPGSWIKGSLSVLLIRLGMASLCFCDFELWNICLGVAFAVKINILCHTVPWEGVQLLLWMGGVSSWWGPQMKIIFSCIGPWHSGVTQLTYLQKKLAQNPGCFLMRHNFPV